MVGYAATARIRTASPPMSHRCYYDRMDWWNYVASLPEPRVTGATRCRPQRRDWEPSWVKFTPQSALP